MSITGSGAHGIMATMPLYAEFAVRGLPEEKLLRATVLSYLVCMYIKAYSGRLSALCGCAIAGGTGAACGLCFLRDGTEKAVCKTIDNMASGLTGMICDGGNQGCVMKGIAACEMAFDCADLAAAGISVDSVHGINGRTPEETMRNIGLSAPPGGEADRREYAESLHQPEILRRDRFLPDGSDEHHGQRGSGPDADSPDSAFSESGNDQAYQGSNR